MILLRKFDVLCSDVLEYATREDAPALFALARRIHARASALEVLVVEDLALPVRAYHCVKNAGINTALELAEYSAIELRGLRNCGAGSVADIEHALRVVGLALRPAGAPRLDGARTVRRDGIVRPLTPVEETRRREWIGDEAARIAATPGRAGQVQRAGGASMGVMSNEIAR
jgi:hypothetical protein